MSLKPTLLVLLTAAPALAEPALTLSLFSDARAGWQTAERDSAAPAHRGFERTAAGTENNGFSLAVVGLDATAGTNTAQAVVSLRFGPSIVAWHGNDPAAGLDNLLQGYVRWKPADEITLDLGQFTTIYGAEVADSHKNKNYTRGALFWLMQPFWHTGLRAGWQASEALTLTAIVVNGINNITDDDNRPSVGLQASWAAGGGFTLTVGGLQSLNPDTEPSGIDTFFDVVAAWQGAQTSAVLNLDLGLNTGADAEESNGQFQGGSLIVHRALGDTFGLAGRVELLMDPEGRFYGQDTHLETFTLTLEATPFSGLVLRWDNRVEQASTEVFVDGDAAPTSRWFASVLGVVYTFDADLESATGVGD